MGGLITEGEFIIVYIVDSKAQGKRVVSETFAEILLAPGA